MLSDLFFVAAGSAAFALLLGLLPLLDEDVLDRR
jgi:hypothetical protein